MTEYTYSGDLIYSATHNDTTCYFSHNSLGGVTYDGLSQRTIQYSYIGFPAKILDYNNTVLAEYCYLADGTKLSAERADGTDFGARNYSPALGRWLAPDPLSEKYYGISPYAYCAGDPVNKFDGDGRKIYFAKGSSPQFKKAFAEAVKIMNAKGTSYNLAKLENSEQIFLIQESSKNIFDYTQKAEVKGTILWNPYQVYINESTQIMISPLTSLAHEASHANAYRLAIESNNMDHFLATTRDKSDPIFETIEEKRAITTDEQIAARRHGEITDTQVTRRDHSFSPVNIKDKPDFFKKKSIEEIVKYVRKHNLTVY